MGPRARGIGAVLATLVVAGLMVAKVALAGGVRGSPVATAAKGCGAFDDGGPTLGLGKPATTAWQVAAYGLSCVYPRAWARKFTFDLKNKELHPSTYNRRIEFYADLKIAGHDLLCVTANNGPAHGGGCYSKYVNGQPVMQSPYFTWVPVRHITAYEDCDTAHGGTYMFGQPGNGGLKTSTYAVSGLDIKCGFARKWVAILTTRAPSNVGHPPGSWHCSVGSGYMDANVAANGDCVNPRRKASFHWDPVNYQSSARDGGG